ncbi:nudC domain-containing protein 3 [Venturia canescens]|uniref:nudC domain-containing protein 3 n=1 Tax=Venturia canescens TaxID=32260 RepID=UPI001C9D339C|nr:nudC domain-containing protein 3 [Venturia canescens]
MDTEAAEYVAPSQPPESYNGAKNVDYTWSQSISDVDVIVNIPENIKTSNDLRVRVSSTRIKVEIRKKVLPINQRQDRSSDDSVARESPDEWTAIFQGQLSFPIKKNESIWCLTSGKRVDIHLEKCKEIWWQALIDGEKKIDLAKIDCSRDFDDLSEQEQMKLSELMWKERMKILTKNNPRN